MNITNNIHFTDHQYNFELSRLTGYCLDYNTLRTKVLHGDFDHLNKEHLTQVLSFIESCDYEGKTAVERSIAEGEIEFLEKLINLGINLNDEINVNLLKQIPSQEILNSLFNLGLEITHENINAFIEFLIEIAPKNKSYKEIHYEIMIRAIQSLDTSFHNQLKDNGELFYFWLNFLDQKNYVEKLSQYHLICKVFDGSFIYNSIQNFINRDDSQGITAIEDLYSKGSLEEIDQKRVLFEIISSFSDMKPEHSKRCESLFNRFFPFLERDPLYHNLKKFLPQYEIKVIRLLWALLKIPDFGFQSTLSILKNSICISIYQLLPPNHHFPQELIRSKYGKQLQEILNEVSPILDSCWMNLSLREALPRGFIPFILDLGLNLNQIHPFSLTPDFFPLSEENLSIYIAAIDHPSVQVNTLDLKGRNVLDYMVSRSKYLTKIPIDDVLHYIKVLTQKGVTLTKNVSSNIKDPYLQVVLAIVIKNAEKTEWTQRCLSNLTKGEREQIQNELNKSKEKLLHITPARIEGIDPLLKGQIKARKIGEWIKDWDTKKTQHLLMHLFESPDQMQLINKKLLKSKKIVIRSFGSCMQTLPQFVVPILSKLPVLNNHDTQLREAFRSQEPLFFVKTLPIKGKIIKQIGRTIITQKKSDPEKLYAYKFCKITESLRDFTREACVTRIFKERPEYKSEFHQPIAVYAALDVPNAFKEKNLSKKRVWYVYHYETNHKYLTYLHDSTLSNKDYYEGRKCFLADSATQVRQGIHPYLADLYHNYATGREYIPLPSIMYQKVELSDGAGRLDRAFKGVEFPNARLNGSADMGDAHLLEDLVKDPCLVSKDLLSDTQENFLQMHALSKLLLVDMLVLIYRYKKLGRINWKNSEFNQEIGSQLLKGCALTLKNFTGQNLNKCKIFLKDCGLDWESMGKMLSFWVDNTENGYLNWLKEGKLPERLYQTNYTPYVDPSNMPNFDPELGFTQDGNHLDIGAYNGPLGLPEIEKAWAVTSLWAIGLANNQS